MSLSNQSNITLIYIDWVAVVEIFRSKYNAVFAAASKKAHLDCVDLTDKTIDGAKSKWMEVVLMDAVLHGVSPAPKSRPTQSRRAFDQVCI